MYSRRTAFLLPILIAVLWVLAGFTRPGVGMRGTDIGLSSDINRGGSAKVDTFDFLVRESTYPNGQIPQADGYYDILNEGTGGATVRWGYVEKGQPTNVGSDSTGTEYLCWTRTFGNEDNNASWATDQRFMFIWFDISDLEAGQKVESANVSISTVLATTTIDAGEFMWLRADTISADYRIRFGSASGADLGWGTSTAVGTSSDAARFTCSWDHIVNGDTSGVWLEWDPPLDSRDDYHDFGPRADSYVGAGSYNRPTSFVFDITDALQQVLDNAVGDQSIIDRGLLLLLYGTETGGESALRFAGGNDALIGSTYDGNPSMWGRVTSRRGVKPWGGSRVPVAVAFDRAWPGQRDFAAAFIDSGLVFDAAMDSSGFYLTDRAWIDSLREAQPGLIDLHSQGVSHYALGLVGPDSTANELERGWWQTEWTTPVDTSTIVDWTWAGGPPGDLYKDREAIFAMVDYGYRFAKDGGTNWLDSDADIIAAGRSTEGFAGRVPFSWENPVHMYLARGLSLQYIMTQDFSGTWSAAATTAQITEQMGDYVDKYYTDYGKSAILFYAHKQAADEYLTGANIRHLIGLSRSTNWFSILPQRTIVSRRLSGAEFATPAVVEAATGWTQQDSTYAKTMAGQQDSLYQADGSSQLLEMWAMPPASYSSSLKLVANASAPSNLQAVGGDGIVVLSWTDTSPGATSSFNVYRYYEGSPDTTLIASPVSSFTSDTSTPNGTEAFYFVSAENSEGTESYDSSHVSAIPGGALTLPAPAYFAMWYDDPPASSPSSAQYDSLAAFDLIATGPFPQEGDVAEPFYAGMIDSLRARNNDIVVLNYSVAVLPYTNWASAAAGTPQRRTWDFLAAQGDSSAADASYGFAQNLSGFVAEGDAYPLGRWTNIMTAAYADTIARYYVDAYEGSGVDGEHTGFFIDLNDSTLTDGYCAEGCQSIMDFDQDGTAFSSDADEQAAYKAFQIGFIKALRREFAERGMGDRLIVANGRYGWNNASVAKYLDGYMIEAWNQYIPGPQGSEAVWENAAAATDLLVNAQTSPPLVLWSARLDSSAAYVSEPVALANGGLVNVQDADDYLGNQKIPAMVRRLPVPGTLSAYDAAGDTLAVSRANYDAYLDINHTAADTFGVWPYLVIAANGDTISRGGGWPRADDPRPEPAFSADVTSGAAPLTVTFTDESTNTPTSWLWRFGDAGLSESTSQNPSFEYTAAGSYDVQLYATNASGTKNLIKTDYIAVTDSVGSGSFTNGNSYVIDGTGFGTKTVAAPVVWEQWDTSADWTAGQFAGTDSLSGDLNGFNFYSQFPGSVPVYLSTVHARAAGSRHTRQGNIGDSYVAVTGYPDGGAGEELWVSGWYWGSEDGFSGGSHSFKMMNISGRNLGGPPWGHPQLLFGGDDNVTDTSTTRWYNGVRDESGNDVLGAGIDYASSCFAGSWIRMDFYANLVDGTGVWTGYRDGGEWFTSGSLDLATLVTTYPLTEIAFSAYYGSDSVDPGTGEGHWSHWDDIYVDNTPMRVELGDAATYAACTQLEVQPATAWSNTEITITVNTGAFADGDTAYVFVMSDPTTSVHTEQVIIGAAGAPDTAAPDTAGVFVAAMFDTTMAGASDVMVGVHVDAAQSDEPLLARFQWKNAYNGTWAPADSTGEWHPATVATDSFMMWQQTGASTSAIEGDTLYVRVALRDDESTPNISQWIDITSPIAKVFARAVIDTAAPDTAGVFAAALFDTTTGGSSNVMVGMHLDAAQSDEPLFARMQWKNAYNGTWAPSDSSGQWHPASVASDSFIVWQQTSATTASLDADTLYVRARLRDDESTPNISPWIDLGDPIAKVFAQEVPSGADYDAAKGFVYVYDSVTASNIKVVIYDGSDNLVAVSNSATVTGTPAWIECTFASPPTLTAGGNYRVAAVADGYWYPAHTGTAWEGALNTTGSYASPPDPWAWSAGDGTYGDPSIYVTNASDALLVGIDSVGGSTSYGVGTNYTTCDDDLRTCTTF